MRVAVSVSGLVWPSAGSCGGGVWGAVVSSMTTYYAIRGDTNEDCSAMLYTLRAIGTAFTMYALDGSGPSPFRSSQPFLYR